jgi:hypothetical protein
MLISVSKPEESVRRHLTGKQSDTMALGGIICRVIRLPFLYAYPLHKERLIASLRLALERLPLFAGRAIKDSDGDYAVVMNGMF